MRKIFRDFDDERKPSDDDSLIDSLLKWMSCLWIVWVLFLLVVMGVGLYVAVHFLAKVW